MRVSRVEPTELDHLEPRVLLAAVFQEFSASPAGQPQLGNNPVTIVNGPGNQLWYTVRGSNRIIRFDPNNPTVSPATSETPQGLAVDANGVLWYTAQNANKIGRYDPVSNQITEYNIPSPASYPTGITVGPNGFIWFTEQSANKIGRLNPATGQITEYAVPTANSSPYSITFGPGGYLWFTSYNASKIGRVDPSNGQIQEYSTPTARSGPLGITGGPDGQVWFTQFNVDRVGRLNPATGAISEFVIPRDVGAPAGVVSAGPQGITTGPGGFLYFTQTVSGRIGRISTSGAILSFTPPASAGRPTSIVQGGDGALWFTQFDEHQIGKMVETTRSAPTADFDGDGRSDLAMFRADTAQWLVKQSGGGVLTNRTTGGLPVFGASDLADIPIAADFDGDGRSDLGVFRTSTAQWLVLLSGGGVLKDASGGSPVFGAPNLMDIPVPGDYDGDGKADLAVFRPATAQWLVKLSGGGILTDAARGIPVFGAPNLLDIPVPGDYDGDGKADLAVFRPATAQWLVKLSGGGILTDAARGIPVFGAPNLLDIPVPGDYDGDGKADLAVFRPATAQWLVKLSGGGILTDPVRGGLPVFGAPNLLDIPIQASIASLLKLGRLGSSGVRMMAASLQPSQAALRANVTIPLVGATHAGEPDPPTLRWANRRS